MKIKQVLSLKKLLLIGIIAYGLIVLFYALSNITELLPMSDMIDCIIAVIILTIIIISVRYRSDFSLPKPLRIIGWIFFFIWIASLFLRAYF